MKRPWSLPGPCRTQLVEAERDVAADRLDDLLGIVGADEARVRAVEVRVGEALHLDRVLDALLLLGRERQRGPPVGVLEGALAVAVVGDLELDHPPQRGRIAPGLPGAGGEVGEQLLVQRGVLAAGADEAVAGAPRELRRERPGCGDVDRHRLLGPVVDGRALGLVVLAVEVDALLAPEPADQLDRLRQPQPPLLAAGERAAGDRRLVHRLAGADAEEDAAGREAAERREGLRDHGRLVAQRRGEHARAERRAARALAGRAEPRQRGRAVPAVVAPGLEVVGDRDDLEAGALRLLARSRAARPARTAPPTPCIRSARVIRAAAVASGRSARRRP